MFPKYLPLSYIMPAGREGGGASPRGVCLFFPLFPRVLAITNIAPLHSPISAHTPLCIFIFLIQLWRLTHFKICYHFIKCIRNLRKYYHANFVTRNLSRWITFIYLPKLLLRKAYRLYYPGNLLEYSREIKYYYT